MKAMRDPLFTIVLATYNNRDLLPRAIQSALNQTFPDFELLVIDDGSADDTRFVVERIGDSRIRYVLNPAPSGSCDYPRNLGIRMAKGSLIAFLDEDDLWYPRRLEKVEKAFDEHPEVSAVCHSENRRVNGRITGVNRYGPWTDNFYEILIYERNCLSPVATTIKADLLRELNGFVLRKEFDGAADYDLWLRMAGRKAKIHFIEEPLGEFSVTGNNLSTVDPAFESKVAFLLREHILNYEQKPVSQLSKKGLWRLFQQYYIAGRGFLRAGEYKNAFRCYLQAASFLLFKPALGWKVCSVLFRRRIHHA